jgi:hypothetical protein
LEALLVKADVAEGFLALSQQRHEREENHDEVVHVAVQDLD